jgi:hypothetical protein
MTGQAPPPGFEVPVGELLIVRSNPFGADALSNDAAGDFAERSKIAAETGGDPPQDYQISVFARRREEGQTSEALYTELVAHALQYLRGARKVAVVMESELNAALFYLESGDPPPDHYNVVLGTDRAALRSQELAEVFLLHGRIKV